MATRFQVTVKGGDVSKTSRTIVAVPDGVFDFDIDGDYATLMALVNARVGQAMALWEHKSKRLDTTMYMRPTAYATQKDLIGLDANNFRSRIVLVAANHAKRKKITSLFVCEIVVFVVKKASAAAATSTLRRATASRIVEAAADVDGFLDGNPTQQVGEISRSYWAVSHVRQPEGTAVSVPDSATFRQMQHIDSLRSDTAPEATEPEYCNLNVSLNGSSQLQLTFRRQDLRAALGLPSHSLIAEGIFRSFVPPAMPTADVEDVDHRSESDQNSDEEGDLQA